MALIFPPISTTTILSPYPNNNKLRSSSKSKFRIISSLKSNLDSNFNLSQSKSFPILTSKPISPIPWKIQPKPLNLKCRDGMNGISDFENTIDFDFHDSSIEDDLESPWEGAIIYKRNPSISHLEYCTTLERLGFEELSSDVSKSRASEMGLRVTKAVKDFPLGTPVQISIDVTRKKQRLRLDGVIKTVLTLSCNRCGGPAAESVFSNFTMLLNEEPIEEPDIIDMGTIFGEDKTKKSALGEDEDGEDLLVDLDDRLYFPPEDKEIDISKNIRDLIHIEITINSICDAKCKGICLKCGTNLNTGSCNCNKQDVKPKNYGPLGGLKNQMQER